MFLMFLIVKVVSILLIAKGYFQISNLLILLLLTTDTASKHLFIVSI